jgi:hypothetical protein
MSRQVTLLLVLTWTIHNLTNHLGNLYLSFQDVCKRARTRLPLPEQIVSKWWFWQCCILHCIIYIHIKFILNSETESNTWRKKCKKESRHLVKDWACNMGSSKGGSMIVCRCGEFWGCHLWFHSRHAPIKWHHISVTHLPI